MPFNKQDFESGSPEDVWQIVPAGGEPVVGPITLSERYLIVHEYKEAWCCRVHHEVPYDQISRRMKYPAEIAAALDAPAGTAPSPEPRESSRS